MRHKKGQPRKVNRCFTKVKTVFSVLVGRHSLPRNPVPVDRIHEADLIGIKDTRTCNGLNIGMFADDLAASINQESIDNPDANQEASSSYDLLTISGGGANGAFGAGFMCGWTHAGTKPDFKVVTGISTGAVIATLSFVGPEYDRVIKKIYTGINTQDVYHRRSGISWLWNDSFLETGPLKRLIERFADQNLLKAVAKVHNKGKRLYVGTSNLDTQQLVVWNMGKLANSGHPDALDIFHKILLASLSMPCVFPPVYIDVEVDGEFYDEMHVDGGMVTDALICDFMLRIPAVEKNSSKHAKNIYIIRNDKLKPYPEQVARNLPKIARRALSTLSKMHSNDHLLCLYAMSQTNDFNFNYIGVPEEYDLPNKLNFDQKLMNKLFDFGFELAQSESNWHKTPPSFDYK